MKKTIFSLLMLIILMGCSDGGSSRVTELYIDDVVMISDIELPVYPNSIVDQQYGNIAAFTTKDDVDMVRTWIETKMSSDDWRSYNKEWSVLGDTFNRDFQRGASLNNPAFGEENVKVLVGPNKDGGAYYSITVIPTGKK